MSVLRNLKLRGKRRVLRVRSRQHSRGEKLRVSVFRSLKHICAQVIDDAQQVTLASYSSRNILNPVGSKKELAKQVGIELGKIAAQKGISEVFFDRGGVLYHGRIKALADGLRESGLKF